MKKITLWQLVIMLSLFFSINSFGQEILLNGDFEAWDDATHPTSWTKAENIDQESIAADVHSGTYSAKQTGGTKDLGQYVGGIIPGDSYTISLWYKVVPGDGSDARIWSYWRSGGVNLTDNANELRGPNNSYFDNNGGIWTEYTTTITAPATADEFYFEVRTYSGAITYWDDFSVLHTVSAPTFSPAAGTYYSSQDVTISTTTAGATIYYTTDGNDPTTSSTVYSTPITISADVTLKAFATKTGETDSPISTADYTFITPISISDLATLRTQAIGNDVYQLTGEAFLTYQLSYRNQKYIQDGTGAILIDDNSGIITTTYTRGDGITGIIGKLSSYNGMLQFTPQIDPGAATSTGNAIFATIITATEFTTNFEAYEAQLVRITNLTFSDGGGTFANGTVYPVTDDNSVAMNFRTNFYNVDYIGTTIPSVEQDIIGLAIQRDNTTGTYFLTARDLNDITDYPRVPLGSTGIVIAILLITVVIFIRKGRMI